MQDEIDRYIAGRRISYKKLYSGANIFKATVLAMNHVAKAFEGIGVELNNMRLIMEKQTTVSRDAQLNQGGN